MTDFQHQRRQHNQARKTLVKQKVALLRTVLGRLWSPKKTLHVIQPNQTQNTSKLLESIPLNMLEQTLRAQLPPTLSKQPLHFTTVQTTSRLSLPNQVETITTIMRDARLLGHMEALDQEDIHQISGGGLPYVLQHSLIGIPRNKLDPVLDHFQCPKFEVTDEMKEKTPDGIGVVLFFTGTAAHWAATALYNVLDNNNIRGRREMLVDVAFRGEGSVTGSGRAGLLNIDQCLRDTSTSSTHSLGGLTWFSNTLTMYNKEAKKAIVSLGATGANAVLQYQKLDRNAHQKKKSKKRHGEKDTTKGRSMGNPILRKTIYVNKMLDTQLKPFPFQEEKATELMGLKGARDRTLTANFIEQVRKLTSVVGHYMLGFEFNSIKSPSSNTSSKSSSSSSSSHKMSSLESSIEAPPSAEAIYEVMDRMAANVYRYKDPNELHIDGTNFYPTGLTSPCASGQSYNFPSETSVELMQNDLFLIRGWLRIAYTETSITVMWGSDAHAAPSIHVPHKPKILNGDRVVASPTGNHTGNSTMETQVLERGSTCTYASQVAFKPDPLLSVVSNPIETYGDLFQLLEQGQYIVLYGCRIYRIKKFDRNTNHRGESVLTLSIIRTTPPCSTVEVPLPPLSLPLEMKLKLSEMESVDVFGGWASGRGSVRDEVGLVRPEILQVY